MTEQRDFRLGDKVSIDGRFPAVTVTGLTRLNGRETYRVEDADGETHEWIAANRLSHPISPLFAIDEAVCWAEDRDHYKVERVTQCPTNGFRYEIRDQGIVHTGVPESHIRKARLRGEPDTTFVEEAVFGDNEWQPLDSANDALPWIGSQVDIRDEGGRLHTGKLLMVQAEETTTTLILSGEASVRISDGLCIRDSRPFQDIDTHEAAIALIGKLCELAHGSEGFKWLTKVESVTVYGDFFEIEADPDLGTASSEYGPIRARVIGE